MHESLVAEGCIVLGAHLSKTIVGIRSRIGSQVRLSETLMLGADSYETLDAMKKTLDAGVPPLGIGEGTRIERAIVDKNARIGRDVRILREGRAPFADGPLRNDGSGPQYFIRDGIVIVPKGGVVADGTVI